MDKLSQLITLDSFIEKALENYLLNINDPLRIVLPNMTLQATSIASKTFKLQSREIIKDLPIIKYNQLISQLMI